MLRPTDVEATIRVVSPFDDAIDKESSDLEAYRQALINEPSTAVEKHIKFKDGLPPTYFRVGTIPPDIWFNMKHQYSEDDGRLYWNAFLFGLRDIENPGDIVESSTDADGKVKREVPKVTINGVQYVKSQWLSNVMSRDNMRHGVMVGMAAYRFNVFTDEDQKN